MYAVGGPAYLGPACVALGVGSGVSIVAFRDELCVFYPLDSAPTFVGAGCAAVVAGGPSLGVCISPGRSFRLWRLRLLPFLGGCVLDAGGVGRHVSEIAVSSRGGRVWARLRGGVGVKGAVFLPGGQVRGGVAFGLLGLGFLCCFTWGWGSGWRWWVG